MNLSLRLYSKEMGMMPLSLYLREMRWMVVRRVEMHFGVRVADLYGRSTVNVNFVFVFVL